MNEKIELLVDQTFTSYTVRGNRKIFSFDEDSITRLVNLLVDQCVQVCNSRAGNSDYNTGRMHCASDIKEYFGVK